MAAKSLYRDYYESGTAARKREDLETKRIPDPKKKVKVQNKNKKSVNPKANIKYAKHVVTILFIFGMSMFLTYRYTLINEKNLDTQKLKKELAGVEASLLNAQIEVEQNTDLKKIEDYAKQKLGMQKPGKNQTIYVDTSTEVTNTVESNESTTFIDNIIDSIKNFFNNIF